MQGNDVALQLSNLTGASDSIVESKNITGSPQKVIQQAQSCVQPPESTRLKVSQRLKSGTESYPQVCQMCLVSAVDVGRSVVREHIVGAKAHVCVFS